MRGVILSSLTDNNTCSQTGNNREGKTEPILNTQEIENGKGGNGYQYGTDIGAERQRTEQILHGSSLFGANQEYTQQREENTNGSYQHRSNDSLQLDFNTGNGKSGCTKGGSRKHRTAITLVEVGTHTGYITYIVAYIIGNSGRIARVVLGDICLHLAYDVSAYIGSFGVDTATHTGKERLRRSTHTEGQHRGGDGNESVGVELVEHNKPNGNVEQAKTYHRQTHDSTGTEGNLQTGIQTLTGCISRTGRSVGGSLHAEETSQT